MSRFIAFLLGTAIFISVFSAHASGQRLIQSQPADAPNGEVRRVPAEWEPQEAVWMQWPKGGWETSYRENFSEIIDALQEYEPINIAVLSSAARTQAQNFLTSHGVPLTNIEWHIMPYDWAWMRDNGPVWLNVGAQVTRAKAKPMGSGSKMNKAKAAIRPPVVKNRMIVQDWGFDAWGELDPYWENDDAVPGLVAGIEGLPCETYALINERGTLEFNGVDTLITSWVCLSDRNPGWSQSDMEALFKDAFGVTKVVWLLSAPPDDLTKGHVDGIARFIDENTVVVARYVNQNDPDAWVYEEAASIIATAGFNVVRLDVPGYVIYDNVSMAAVYVNWLVANGAVIMTGFGVPEWDNAAKAAVEGFFPDRDVHVVETLELWRWGGGVHCVTNDQPAQEP